MRAMELVAPDLYRRHPKVIMGFSDSTVSLLQGFTSGLSTFYGPSVMAGFSQIGALGPSFSQHVRDVLFGGAANLVYSPYPEWSDGYPDWATESSVSAVTAPRINSGWRWLQGTEPTEGHLLGGSFEALEMLKGTRSWPGPTQWGGAILFLETSHEKPSVEQFKRGIRNYGLQGVLSGIKALLVGRPAGYTEEENVQLEAAVSQVVRQEFGLNDLVVVTRMDFGHTHPQWVLPLGGRTRIDPVSRSMTLSTPSVT